jgi:hypothetical protein
MKPVTLFFTLQVGQVFPQAHIAASQESYLWPMWLGCKVFVA